ncbi:MAG: type I-C CRISPR-associated protein Cas5, partial [Thermoanaerobacteraceae bacterium]|nr:type I-C CRISPR-associated protein Cas5 [Thermoanaerobacteraceae bacterium]
DVRYRIYGYFDFIPPEQRKNNISVSPEFWADYQEETENVRKDETEAKYAAMFERRAKKGQCFHRPYLGCREFACFFCLVEPNEEKKKPIDETRDLGFMLYDMDFKQDKDNPSPLFFRAYLDKGVINTDRREVEVRG